MADAKKPEGKSGGHVGAVLAAAVAITTGVYFFATKKGKQQRVKLQGWVAKAERDVGHRLERLGEANKEAYDAVIDAVLVNYQKAKKVDKKALEELRSELQAHWEGIEQSAKQGMATGKHAVKRVQSEAKKVVRKATA